ncbi:MAG: hypothetical protein HY360_13580 [Verrucomicrobia bacterium]|nr:hypothetical protein [Verrucomicrobiota bacterium]
MASLGKTAAPACHAEHGHGTERNWSDPDGLKLVKKARERENEMKLYIETSVPNFLFAADAPEKRQVTVAFFEWLKICRDEVFISKLVEEELRPAPEPKRGRMTAALNEIPLKVLEVPAAASELADFYLSAGIVPVRFKNDALHVATAVWHRLDIVVSWNMKHLVNVRKVARINEVNGRHGFPLIRIHTPEEVMDL